MSSRKLGFGLVSARAECRGLRSLRQQEYPMRDGGHIDMRINHLTSPAYKAMELGCRTPVCYFELDFEALGYTQVTTSLQDLCSRVLRLILPAARGCCAMNEAIDALDVSVCCNFGNGSRHLGHAV